MLSVLPSSYSTRELLIHQTIKSSVPGRMLLRLQLSSFLLAPLSGHIFSDKTHVSHEILDIIACPPWFAAIATEGERSSIGPVSSLPALCK